MFKPLVTAVGRTAAWFSPRLCLLLSALSTLAAPAKPAVPPVNPQSLATWRAMRFGMFIHWGPVSLRGTEIGWSRGAQVPVAEYDQLYTRFNPTNFNADAWMRLARDAGMKYVVFTTKHHDGFCMWDSDQTDFDILASPFHRDVVKELAEACRRQGVMFAMYHSICDWHHPDYPRGSPGGKTAKPAPDMDRYNAYLKAQLKELLTRYGPVGILWFDGEWEKPWTAERGVDLYRWVRSLQPDILINNRVAGARHGMAGTSAADKFAGDYDTPEQRIGAYQDDRPWETCMTICRQWAWKPNDRLKSLAECVETLVNCAGGDGNLLLNVGPRPDGSIEPRQAVRLREIGAWLRVHGEAIYDTRGGPWKPNTRIASTRRGNVVYLHLLRGTGRTHPVELPALSRRVIEASVLGGGRAFVTTTGAVWRVRVEGTPADAPATVVKLRLDGSAMSLPAVGVPRPGAGKASASNTYHNQEPFAPGAAFDDDSATRWATDSGTHEAWIMAELPRPRTVRGLKIKEASPYDDRVQRFEIACRDSVQGAWRTVFKGERLGADFSCAFGPVRVQAVRLNILEATEGPTLSEIELVAP